MGATRSRASVAGAAAILLLAPITPGRAEESASYRLTGEVFNAGGRPAGVSTSPGVRLTLESIGEALAGPGATGASFRLDGGFVVAYAPPGEVAGLRFLDAETLAWSALDSGGGGYCLYRDDVAALPGLGYGVCLQPHVDGTTAADAATPLPATAFFYLVTGKNRLGEEGTKGFHSDGTGRGGPTCP